MRNVIENNHGEGLRYWISSARVIPVNSLRTDWKIYGTETCSVDDISLKITGLLHASCKRTFTRRRARGI